MEDNNSMEISNSDIKKLIYTIRGKQVILDSDVAMLYKTETRVINQTVKRNINRFPERFCFQLTEKEYENLKSQIVISSFKKENSYGGRRKMENGTVLFSIFFISFLPLHFIKKDILL